MIRSCSVKLEIIDPGVCESSKARSDNGVGHEIEARFRGGKIRQTLTWADGQSQVLEFELDSYELTGRTMAMRIVTSLL
ncbi:MAG: hypothetical protein KGL39_34365 [Patescibacteria group bacterium]|nr:hypothetical protein [Patescibacteria group bacterium]